MKLTSTIEYFQENLYEMSNYNSNNTGLLSGTTLWIRTEPTSLLHTKYRIKINHPQKGSAIFSLWGDEAQQVADTWNITGKDLQKILTLIKLTNKNLRKHIDGKIDSKQLGDDLLNAKPQVELI